MVGVAKRKSITSIIEAQKTLFIMNERRIAADAGPLRRIKAITLTAVELLLSKGYTQEDICKTYNILPSAFDDMYKTIETKKKRHQVNKDIPKNAYFVDNNQLDEILDCIEMLREMVIALKNSK